MIKYFFLLLIIIFLLAKPVIAAPAQPTPLPSQNLVSTDSSELKKIEKIKEIVASKVAELNLIEKRGIIGTVKDNSTTQVTIVDIKGNTRYIDIDELTKFSLGTAKSNYGISDIKKGETYAFVGLYNKDSKRLLARDVLSTNNIPVTFDGAILAIDNKNYDITIVNGKGEKMTVDIENSTRTSLGSTTGDLVRSGFSKLSTNVRVIVIGFFDKKDKTLLMASRLIYFQDIPPSKEMEQYIQTPTTASSSGKITK